MSRMLTYGRSVGSRPRGLIMGKDEDIWMIIVNKLDNTSARHFRLVRKECKSLADNLYKNWKVELDDGNLNDSSRDYHNFLWNLKLEKLLIRDIQECLSDFRPEGIMKYPKILRLCSSLNKSLRFVPVVEGAVVTCYAEDLNSLLKCGELEELELTHVSVEDENFFIPSNPRPGYNFPVLTELKLVTFTHEEANGILGFLDHILASAFIPNLKTFHLELDNSEQINEVTSNFMRTLFSSFFPRNSEKLEILFLYFISRPNEILAETEEFLDRIYLGPSESLKSIQFLNTGRHLERDWESFLKFQKNLNNLDVDSLMWASLATTLSNCALTLTHIQFRSLLVRHLNLTCDLSVFRTCVALRHLEISLFEGIRFEISGMEGLPNAISHLKLVRFFIPTEVLVNFSAENRKCLVSIEILHAGEITQNGVNYGFNATVLNNFSQFSHLEKICIGDRSIDPSIIDGADRINLDIFFELIPSINWTRDEIELRRFTKTVNNPGVEEIQWWDCKNQEEFNNRIFSHDI